MGALHAPCLGVPLHSREVPDVTYLMAGAHAETVLRLYDSVQGPVSSCPWLHNLPRLGVTHLVL